MALSSVLRLMIILIILCAFMPTHTNSQVGGMENGSGLKGWHRDKKCKYEMLKVLQTFTKANRLNQNTDDNWSVYLPCGYNAAEREFHTIKSSDPKQKIFIIKGHDNLSRKDTLWNNLRRQYGDSASEIMPNTYQLFKPEDINRLNSDYSQRKVYILKKNIQRQQGLKMTKNRSELLNGNKQGYVVAQEMLQDPLLVDGRKTNCRIYLLVVCRNGKKSGYMYNNGYMYYTPKAFIKDSMEEDRVITAGLSTIRKDSDFYQNHPLTIRELQRSYPNVDLFKATGELLAKVLKASSPTFCNTGHLRERTTFQLFGCDIAFNNRLIPQLIEINKGPDLSSKSAREADVKNDMIASMFKVVGIPVHTNTTGKFISIWEK